MEKERRKLDKQLDVVQEKTKRAYLSQEILEAKMKVNLRNNLSKIYFRNRKYYFYTKEFFSNEIYFVTNIDEVASILLTDKMTRDCNSMSLKGS